MIRTRVLPCAYVTLNSKLWWTLRLGESLCQSIKVDREKVRPRSIDGCLIGRALDDGCPSLVAENLGTFVSIQTGVDASFL